MGSEMCIRDRKKYGSAEVLLTKAMGLATQTASLELKRDVELLFACLLYTSDAADERSSVDLGGRRIIKKKKKGTDT